MAGLLLWLCDKLSRGISSSIVVRPETVEWHPRSCSTMLRIAREHCPFYEAGQYFFINIPSLSLHEWHPFTASAVLDDGLIFYVKVAPKRISAVSMHSRASETDSEFLQLRRLPWSQRLAQLAEAGCVVPPLVRIYGPFGHLEYTNYESLLLFAGGIGITPMIAIFTHLRKQAVLGQLPVKLKTVVLVWMSRTVAEFRMFEEIFAMVARDQMLNSSVAKNDSNQAQRPVMRLEGLASSLTVPSATPGWAAGDAANPASESMAAIISGCSFEVRLHCTRRDSFVSLTDPSSPDFVKLFIQSGRCDATQLFASYAHGTETLAAVCGPKSLTQGVSAQAWRSGTDFHAEEFSF